MRPQIDEGGAPHVPKLLRLPRTFVPFEARALYHIREWCDAAESDEVGRKISEEQRLEFG